MAQLRGGHAYRQTQAFKQAIRERDGYQCCICECGIGDVCDLHYAPVSQVDVAHVTPWRSGGESTPANMRVLCHPCNVRERIGTAGQSAILRA